MKKIKKKISKREFKCQKRSTLKKHKLLKFEIFMEKI